MAKRTKKRQSTLPEPPKPVPALETPVARASFFTIYLIITIIIGLGGAAWYRSYLEESNLSSGETETAVWKVVELPGKGFGMVAKRNISQGTTILREKPLFLVPASIRESPERLIASLVSQLSPEKRRQFNALSHHSNPDSTGEAQMLAKTQTNAISAGDMIGIFPNTARLNHGCSSAFNVAYNWAAGEQELVVQAFKPIMEGEEILTTYTDTKRPRDERRQYLQGAYNFFCTCSVCSLPPEESKRSDERLVEMSRLKSKLSEWGSKDMGGGEATNIINKIWKLGEEEGYWSERGSLAWDAVQVAAAHGQEDATRRWALVAEKWFSIELGPNSLQAKDAANIIRRPKSHPSWGARYRVKVESPAF